MTGSIRNINLNIEQLGSEPFDNPEITAKHIDSYGKQIISEYQKKYAEVLQGFQSWKDDNFDESKPSVMDRLLKRIKAVGKPSLAHTNKAVTKLEQRDLAARERTLKMFVETRKHLLNKQLQPDADGHHSSIDDGSETDESVIELRKNYKRMQEPIKLFNLNAK